MRKWTTTLRTGGNVYFHQAQPYAAEQRALLLTDQNPRVRLERDGDRATLHLVIDRDYFGRRRGKSRPMPGPFERVGSGTVTLRVW
jgi:hypothetical protein